MKKLELKFIFAVLGIVAIIIIPFIEFPDIPYKYNSQNIGIKPYAPPMEIPSFEGIPISEIIVPRDSYFPLGYNTANSLNIDSRRNTIIGIYAGVSNIGYENVAIGVNAGQNIIK